MFAKSRLLAVIYGLIFFTIALAPLYVIRWTYFSSFPTTLLETLILLTTFLWFIYKLKQKDFKLTLPPKRFSIVIGLFFVAGVISIFSSFDLILGLGRFRAFILEPLVFMLILLDLAKSKKYVEKIACMGLFTAGIWLSLLGILQKLGVGIVTADQAYRAHGVYNSGNQLAHVLGPLVLIQFYRLVNGKRKTVDIVLLLVLFTSFLLTDSLGGFIGLIVVGLLIILFAKFHKISHIPILKVILIGGTLGFLLFWWQISAFTPKHINPWDRKNKSTTTVRLCLWEGTKNVLKKNPLFGTGLVGFSKQYSKNYTCDAEGLEEPDNIILLFWTKTGILGLMSILVLLFMIFSTKEVSLVYKIPFVYEFIHGLVDVPYFKNDLSLYWWVFFAVFTVTYLKRRKILKGVMTLKRRGNAQV